MFRIEAEVDKDRRRLLGERLENSNAERSPAIRRLRGTPFQAPEFYRKQGYEVVGRVAEYPPGAAEFVLTKRLGE